MIGFILKRLGLALSQLFAISVLAFTLLYLASGDVARTLMGEQATQAQVALKREQLGLDQPLVGRYIDWLTAAFHGDLGSSWFTSQGVGDALLARLPVTLTLLIGVTLVSTAIAFVLGIAAGVRRGRLDKFVQLLSVLGYALPGFLLALFLVVVFSLRLGWLPATGYVPITTSFTGWLATVTLPIIALAIGPVAGTAAQVRSAVIEVLRQDYVRTLRSRGLSELEVIFKHVVRNASGTGLTVMGLQFVGMLGAAIIVEQIFALPGLGTIAVQYTSRGDIPVVMGLLLVTSLIVASVNLLVDIGVGLLNPKVRVA